MSCAAIPSAREESHAGLGSRCMVTSVPPARGTHHMRASANGRSTAGLDIVCLAHLPWDLVFQRPHHLMTRAARSGEVLYVEEPRADASEPYAEIRRAEGGMQVLVPHLPPA